MNPSTCGVAKFNHRLARELGVPCESLTSGRFYRHPLISIKTSEIGPQWQDRIPAHGDLFLHDRPPTVPAGRRVWFADVVGCPATIDGNPTRGEYRVLVFGMAGKLQLHHYQALKQRLDAEHGDSYTVELSNAVHEGAPFEAGLTEAIESMRRIFGDRLRVLGFLADDALALVLEEVDAVAAYFAPALRRNNTTVWAAQCAGKTIYTNRDDQSPTEMPTWASVIAALTTSDTPATVATMTPVRHPQTAV